MKLIILEILLNLNCEELNQKIINRIIALKAKEHFETVKLTIGI